MNAVVVTPNEVTVAHHRNKRKESAYVGVGQAFSMVHDIDKLMQDDLAEGHFTSKWTFAIDLVYLTVIIATGTAGVHDVGKPAVQAR